ncbi:DUF4254 domain-containing protein [Nocardia sp. NPDC052254]|uniref:DUF4254 domain-containing protein n=1 Tax=Nocardia sp. NPDC052254 TaxID=3155681 RepID=UPI003421439C
MIVKLPSPDELLEACNGTIRLNHPVLHAARDLTALHADRRSPVSDLDSKFDCPRAELVCAVDRWVASHLPQARGASYLHAESIGMVIDRIAQYRVDAHAALSSRIAEPHRHFLWQRLAELTVAYGDLAFEISAGMRNVPALTYLVDATGRRSIG